MTKKQIAIFMILMIQSLCYLGSSIETNSQQDFLYFSVNGLSDTGEDASLFDWLRIPEVWDNPDFETALVDDTSDYCIAILDTGLDSTTWTHLEDVYDVNFRLFLPDGNTFEEVTKSNGVDIGDHHGTCLCSMLGYLLDGTSTDVLVFRVIGDDFVPNAQWVCNALDYIKNLYTGSTKVKAVSMSFRFLEESPSVKLKILPLTIAPYRITFFASSGNALAGETQNEEIFPAAYRTVFGVGGIIFKDTAHIGERMTTARGATYNSMYRYSSSLRGSTPIVVAPGESIKVSCDSNDDGVLDHFEVSGTSLSSPILSAVTLMMCKIQYNLDPYSYISFNEIYTTISFNSESDGSPSTEDTTIAPSDGNFLDHDIMIGWGGIDFYDYCVWVYEYYEPLPGGGGGGSGPFLE
ncbi:MAG: S8/S53 family peptidase [Candidatus Heimdallarchaeaceae archaeon]